MTIQIDPKYVKKLARSRGTVKQLDPLIVACPKTGMLYPVTTDAPVNYNIGDVLEFSSSGDLVAHTPKKTKARSSNASSGMTLHTTTMTKDKWLSW